MSIKPPALLLLVFFCLSLCSCANQLDVRAKGEMAVGMGVGQK